MIADIAIWPAAASTTAQQIDLLFLFLVLLCGSVGLLVAVLLIYFCIHYRRRPGEVGNPPYSRQSQLLEWFWTLTPLAIFMGIFVWSGVVYVSAFQPPPQATPLYVVGKQWMWKFQHPEGQREINTLHVPAGKPVKLIMISEDVIHSFFVPAFRLHRDVLPARYTTTWFEATRPGEYHLFCSQYCGTDHSGMVGKVIVMEPADYQHWLTESAEGSLALQGRQVFLKYRCLSCHTGDGTAQAPSLEQLYGATVPLRGGGTAYADDTYLRESIFNPSAKIVAGHADVMPSFQGQMSEEEVIALLAYIRGLQKDQTPPRVEGFPAPVGTPAINEEPIQP